MKEINNIAEMLSDFSLNIYQIDFYIDKEFKFKHNVSLLHNIDSVEKLLKYKSLIFDCEESNEVSVLHRETINDCVSRDYGTHSFVFYNKKQLQIAIEKIVKINTERSKVLNRKKRALEHLTDALSFLVDNSISDYDTFIQEAKQVKQ